MPMLETSLATVAYDERGSGEAIVMLPSGGHERRDYDELRAALPDGLRSIAIDWPAHGESPPAQLDGALFFAELAEEVVARLAPEGAIVLGNSVGGFAAARVALRRPELVRGLVIIDGGGFGAHTPLVRGFCALMGRPRVLRAIYPAFSRRYMRARTDADRRARAASIATTRRADGAACVAQLWRSFATPAHDLRADAARITAPTLVVWGERDPVLPLRQGRRAAASIAGARLVTLDTGHVPYTSDPEGVAAALIPFADAAFAHAGERAA